MIKENERPNTKLFFDESIGLYTALEYKELLLTMYLSNHIVPYTCELRMNGKMNGKVIDTHMLADVFNSSYDTIRKNIYTLKNNEIIKIHPIGEIGNIERIMTFNPYLICVGNAVDEQVLNMYKDSKWVDTYRANEYSYLNKNIGNIGRDTPIYKLWISSVLDRDNHKCMCCESTKNLEAHHIVNYANDKAKRIDIHNGITLCEACHSPMIAGSFHNLYGTRNNNIDELQEYFDNKRQLLGLPKVNIENIIK